MIGCATGYGSAMNMTVAELISRGPNGATIINVGKHAGSREIRGAVRYRPDDLLTADHLVLPLPTELPIVLYDEHGTNKHLDEIADKLRTAGFADVYTLDGGFAAYEAAGEPTQEGSTEQVVPPTKPQEVQTLDRRL